MSNVELVKRVERLEREVAELRQKIEGAATPSWKHIVGTFAGDPHHLEAARLGREYRNSLRPKPRKARKGSLENRKRS